VYPIFTATRMGRLKQLSLLLFRMAHRLASLLPRVSATDFLGVRSGMAPEEAGGGVQRKRVGALPTVSVVQPCIFPPRWKMVSVGEYPSTWVGVSVIRHAPCLPCMPARHIFLWLVCHGLR